MPTTVSALNVTNRSGVVISSVIRPSQVGVPAGTNYAEAVLTGGRFTDPATAITARVDESLDGGVTWVQSVSSGWVGGDTATDHSGNVVPAVPKLGLSLDPDLLATSTYRIRVYLEISGTVRCGADVTFYP